jgi:hypothetical protein
MAEAGKKINLEFVRSIPTFWLHFIGVITLPAWIIKFLGELSERVEDEITGRRRK